MDDDNNSFSAIINYLNNNDSIVYPTSTLPALGCKPNKIALDRLFKIKNRSAELPVSLGVIDLEQASYLVDYDNLSIEILDYFPKGSLTLILPAKKKLDQRLGGDWIAIRPVVEEKAIELISKIGPITATSANISGKKPLIDCKKAALELKLNKDQFISAQTKGGLPSTLVKVDRTVTVMREGLISRQEVVDWSKKLT
tara:strand:+ start:149 stop:742 length:594 start_codon:yes stop_codon:yes gene_type:complete